MPDPSSKTTLRKTALAPKPEPVPEVVPIPLAPRKERDCAAIAHALNALPLWGLIGAGAVWVAYRERSRFVASQAQQAMYFHGLLLLSIVVWMLVALFTRLIAYLAPPIGQILDWINWAIFLSLAGLHMTVCAIGAWRCFNGKPFRYPLVGEWLEE